MYQISGRARRRGIRPGKNFPSRHGALQEWALLDESRNAVDEAGRQRTSPGLRTANLFIFGESADAFRATVSCPEHRMDSAILHGAPERRERWRPARSRTAITR